MKASVVALRLTANCMCYLQALLARVHSTIIIINNNIQKFKVRVVTHTYNCFSQEVEAVDSLDPVSKQK